MIEREPDWTTLFSTSSPPIRRCSDDACRKIPRRRLRDIGDARLEIDEAEADDETRPVASDPRKARRPWRWITAGLLGALDCRHRSLVRVSVDVSHRDSRASGLRVRENHGCGRARGFSGHFAGWKERRVRGVDGRAPANLGALARWRQPHQGHRCRPRSRAACWADDSNSILYFTRSETDGPQGKLWEVGALGGPPHFIAKALGGGDISTAGSGLRRSSSSTTRSG